MNNMFDERQSEIAAALRIPSRLVGRYICLEPLKDRHREELRIAADDERIWQHTIGAAHGNRFDDWFEEIKRQITSGRQLPFAVRSVQSGKLVGSTSYFDPNPRHQRIEIGSTWYAPQWWGSQVNPECKLLLLAHAFEILKLNRVSFCTDVLNARSQAAIEKLGASREGIMRCHMVVQGGRVRDSVLYSIISSDWPRLKKGIEKRLAKGPA
ncbi:MAG TPA: GNAT family protein [Candidatus Baltobacteraceae bacterium]|jgi:RimJ/RimL family protein N-acetyltransferase|nr:GNAT family protein [Candidatus Baltobacteraceae bacterium]